MGYKNKDKQREYQRQWIARRRLAYLQDKSCVAILDNGLICGSTNHLQIDHVDASTKVAHQIWSWKKDRRLIELDKCQVLCKDCHDLKSLQEKAKGESNGKAKLATEQVLLIKDRYQAGGITNAELALEYGVHEDHMSKITSRRRWRHL